MNAMRRCLRIGAYHTAMLLFLVLSFSANLVCLIILLVPGARGLKGGLRRFLQKFYQFWARLMRWMGVLDLETPGNTETRSADGEIWVMNHPSLMDASYLFKFISNATCIYKHSIGWNPFYGAIARLADYIPNSSGLGIVRIACAGLARGENLIVFPEGTRSTRIALDNFKPGFALIAKRSAAPINLLWIDSPDDFMTKGQSYWVVPKERPQMKIQQIGRVDPAQFDSVEAIMEEVKRQFREKAASL